MRKRLYISTAILSLSLAGCSIVQPVDEEEKTAGLSPQSEKNIESKNQPVFKSSPENTGEEVDDAEGNQPENPSTDPKEEENSENQLTVVDNPESIQVVVNKQRKLPEGYMPPNLVIPDVPFYFSEDLPKKKMRSEAAQALEKMFAAAEKDGVELVAASGYRSYDRQKTIYQGYVNQYGEEKANTFSAKPGTSEHQTGLAMDITSAQLAFKLDQSFRQTDEGTWLAEHAHEFGFIIRYPKGKDEITGYTYEPWHLRYVGEEISTDIHKQELTLEEFFGLYPDNE
ncbi:D-alanyl-D-alanine carboxypeptidase family protein [Halobacillus yeomjeoni]|uniref:M15 family metallopeptidase n=1 Tax=Halobacillus yeomjeoni TaxID=311194 RepID=A0A931HS58_9BACI|nr:M15 family metallopeptidase [Halobacillus yeomjeoni]MBH0228682.1 M15 family metallopeptidase [Halobacillus yeomjeoni]